MSGFIQFNRGLLKMSLPIRLWLMVLLGANFVAPLFFLQRLEAWLVLGAILVGGVLMSLLTARFGFTRILGLGHVLWIPLVTWLIIQLDQIPSDDAFGLWVRGVILVNTVSLVIDVVDVMRYLAGDRKELVTGLSSSASTEPSKG